MEEKTSKRAKPAKPNPLIAGIAAQMAADSLARKRAGADTQLETRLSVKEVRLAKLQEEVTTLSGTEADLQEKMMACPAIEKLRAAEDHASERAGARSEYGTETERLRSSVVEMTAEIAELEETLAELKSSKAQTEELIMEREHVIANRREKDRVIIDEERKAASELLQREQKPYRKSLRDVTKRLARKERQMGRVHADIEWLKKEIENKEAKNKEAMTEKLEAEATA